MDGMGRKTGMIDLQDVRTFSVRDRKNLVAIGQLARPGTDPVPDWGGDALDALAESIAQARLNGRPVIWSMGAHVVKCGLSRYLIDLIRRGLVTHVSSNGAGSIHDFELACHGGTSEDVPTAIEDGSFGMWEETGLWMNEALQQGAAAGAGYGESLAAYMDRHGERFPHKADCVLHQAWCNGVPATYHIAIGTDIIHQHPRADFGAIGATSGIDFLKLCHAVSRLDGGVFMNFGSAVIGPEVFLKALSIARNLGYPVARITTANFDLVDLGDWRAPLGPDHPQYYYRPRKNILNRPTSLGGAGWHFCGDHRLTVPNLHKRLVALLPEVEKGVGDDR